VTTAGARPLAAALLCALATAAAARDRLPPPGGEEEVRGILAFRAGVALPFGNARAMLPMSDLVSGALPVGVELAGRGGATTFGVAAEYGRAFVASCPAGASCSGAVIRAGIELLHRFSPGSRVSTWVGGGLGWEETEVTRAGRSIRVDSFELLNLQLGRDVEVSKGVLVGPFLAGTFAQGMQQDGKDIKDKSPHVWVQLGFRVELGL
jgi:hypothetical protein